MIEITGYTLDACCDCAACSDGSKIVGSFAGVTIAEARSKAALAGWVFTIDPEGWEEVFAGGCKVPPHNVKMAHHG